MLYGVQLSKHFTCLIRAPLGPNILTSYCTRDVLSSNELAIKKMYVAETSYILLWVCLCCYEPFTQRYGTCQSSAFFL